MKLKQFKEEQVETLSYNSIDWELIELSSWIIDNLPERAKIISYKACNAEERNGNGKIFNTVDEWFTFILDGWKVDFMPGYFWVFEGISLCSYRIENSGTREYYNKNKYSINIDYNNNKDYFLKILSNPEILNSMQEKIPNRPENREYITRKRKIEPVIYGLIKEVK